MIIQLGLNLNIRQKPSVIMLTHMYNLFVCLFCKFWLKYSIKCPMNIYIIRINNNMKIDTHFSMQEMSSQLILCAKKLLMKICKYYNLCKQSFVSHCVSLFIPWFVQSANNTKLLFNKRKLKCQNVYGKKNITVPVTFFGLFFDVFRKAQKQKNTRDAGKSAQTNKTKNNSGPQSPYQSTFKKFQ